MQQKGKYFIGYLLWFIFLPTFLWAQTFPEKPNGLVSDYTQTLSPQEVSFLEHKLVAFSDSTSTQIAVVMIAPLNGDEVANYGVKLAEKWGIGNKKYNNGILLLVSIGDRKITIQTGYGLEGVLPDAIAKRIIEKIIKPYFKKSQYYEGLDQGTDAIIAYTKGEYKDSSLKKKTESNRLLFLIIIILLIIIIISRINKGGGKGNQIIGGHHDESPFWWILLGSLLSNGSRGSHRNWGGGSSDGGFGGGGFGGGGASGDW